MGYEERETPRQPYTWGRIATEAQVIRHLETLGAVDLRRPVAPERGRAKAGFEPKPERD